MLSTRRPVKTDTPTIRAPVHSRQKEWKGQQHTDMASFSIDNILSSHKALSQFPRLPHQEQVTALPYTLLPFSAAAYSSLLRPLSQQDIVTPPVGFGINPILLEQHHQQQLLVRAYQQRVFELERIRLRDSETKYLAEHGAHKDLSRRPSSASNDSRGEISWHTCHPYTLELHPHDVMCLVDAAA